MQVPRGGDQGGVLFRGPVLGSPETAMGVRRPSARSARMEAEGRRLIGKRVAAVLAVGAQRVEDGIDARVAGDVHPPGVHGVHRGRVG